MTPAEILLMICLLTPSADTCTAAPVGGEWYIYISTSEEGVCTTQYLQEGITLKSCNPLQLFIGDT